jgi:hypothetical protein
MKTLTRTKNTNRFNGRLNRNHGVCLLETEVNGTKIEIRNTDHGLLRFAERGVDIEKSLDSIIKFGKVNLYKYANEGIDTGLDNRENNTTTILTFEADGDDYIQVRFATIINRANAYLKNGTRRVILK